MRNTHTTYDTSGTDRTWANTNFYTISTRINQGLRTFSIGFNDPRFDESPFAATAAERRETVVQWKLILIGLARWRSSDMLAKDYFSHTIAGCGCLVYAYYDSKLLKRRSPHVPLERLAVGVTYADKSNIARWGHTEGRDKRCRGNNWFVPYETINALVERLTQRLGRRLLCGHGCLCLRAGRRTAAGSAGRCSAPARR